MAPRRRRREEASIGCLTIAFFFLLLSVLVSLVQREWLTVVLWGVLVLLFGIPLWVVGVLRKERIRQFFRRRRER